MSDQENDYDNNDNLLELPAGMLRTAKYLRETHNEYEAIDAEYKAQRLALEKAFYAKKKEYYEKRAKIISGEIPVPETAFVEDKPKDGEEETTGIPSFWLTCLTSSSLVSQIITSEDMELLESLSNITCEYSEDFTTFTLSFYFDENDYFENKVLTKKYFVTPDLLDEKNPALDRTESSVINWKPGKNLCVSVVEKKQKAKSGKNKGQTRTVTNEVPIPSFFHFFDAYVEEEEAQNDEEDNIKLSIEEDYDIGHAIRTSIIPEATLWFTGENEDAYDYGDMEDDEEEENDDEDDDEDDDADAAPGFSAPAGGNGAAPAPECKNN